MGDLTDLIPKPMLIVAGKTLIEHKLDALPDEVNEIVIVTGYQGELIRKTFGHSYKGKKITYAHQEELNGTGGALWLAAPQLSGRFLVMMGDDLYSKRDVEACLASPDWAVLIEKTENMGMGGKMLVNESDCITGIEEGDHRGTAGLMNTNLHVLDMHLFDHPLIPKAPGSYEYGLPHTVLAAAEAEHIPVHAVYATDWLQITAPEDIVSAQEHFAIEDTP